MPAAAIIFNDDGLHVLVAKDGIAHLRKITETRNLGNEVEADGGVQSGDEVVLSPPIVGLEPHSQRTWIEQQAPLGAIVL